MRDGCAICGHSHCAHPDAIFAGVVPSFSPSPAIPAVGEHLGAGSSPDSAPFSVAPPRNVTADRDGGCEARPASRVNAVSIGVHEAAAKAGNVAPPLIGAPA
jgi:hypothetical protein